MSNSAIALLIENRVGVDIETLCVNIGETPIPLEISVGQVGKIRCN
jgi:hypothetical protein